MCFLSLVLLEVKAQVDAMWEQMNKGVSNKVISSFTSKPKSTSKSNPKKRSSVILCCCYCLAIVVLTVISLTLIFFNSIILNVELDVLFGVGTKGN